MDGAGPKATSIALRGVAEEVTPPPGEYGNQPSSPPKQNVLVLGISKFSKGVSSHPAISGKDVEIPIVPKEQLAPIVVRGWFFNLQNDPKRRYPPKKKTSAKTTKQDHSNHVSFLLIAISQLERLCIAFIAGGFWRLGRRGRYHSRHCASGNRDAQRG